MKYVGLAIETTASLIVDVTPAETVDEAVVACIPKLIERLEGEKIVLIVATTDDLDDVFAASFEKKLFAAVPELFVDHYAWSESY